jgi:hypothetical protein
MIGPCWPHQALFLLLLLVMVVLAHPQLLLLPWLLMLSRLLGCHATCLTPEPRHLLMCLMAA